MNTEYSETTEAVPVSQSNERALVVFPGALGDFLCFLPALVAFAQRVRETILLARSDWTVILDHPRIVSWSIEHPALTWLYRNDFCREEWIERFGRFDVAYSWSGFGDRQFTNNLDAAVETRAFVFPFRAFEEGEHASEYYARCLALEPASRETVQQYLRVASPRNALEKGQRLAPTLFIHPGSGAERKNWRGFPNLARLWRARTGGRIVVALGPTELERGVAAIDADEGLVARPLPEVAGFLQDATLFVGNDSGISHLAALLGIPGLVLLSRHTRAEHWHPRSPTIEWVQANHQCDLCGPEVFCDHVLPAEQVWCHLEALYERIRSPKV